jgi:tetratricopeptide (TPR) repeat protein
MNRGGLWLAMWAVLFGAADSPAQMPTAANCGAPSQAVQEASLALEQNPSLLETRFELADALTHQECYDAAVEVLEAGEALHPENAALEARLRNARSMMSEQRYIEGVTRAEESARLQRNVLRCKRLGDIAACDEALSSRRSDWELLIAKGDALMQQSRGAEALPVYRRAMELNPGNTAVQSKIAGLEASKHARASSAPGVGQRAEPPAAAPVIAAAAKPKSPAYSNEAPAGRTN